MSGRSWRRLALGAVAATVVVLAVVGAFVAGRASVPVGSGSDESASATPSAPSPEVDADLYSPPGDIKALIERATGSTIRVFCGPEDEGSGVVLDVSPLTSSDEPVVITNHHVIKRCLDGGVVRVVGEGLRTKATIVVSNKRRDLALLEVPGLQIAPLPISLDAEPGQWVMTAGAPLGYSNSVSTGIVSAVVPEEYTISSDAVIGPGNSGGPLVNNRGEVLGINTFVWEEAEGITLSTQVRTLCQKVLDCTASEDGNGG